MLNQWLIDALRASKISQSELARELEIKLNKTIPRSIVNKMVNGSRTISADELIAIEEITGIKAPRRNERPSLVPIVGYVGAGSIVHLDYSDVGAYEEVEAPDDATEKTVAVKIEGDCLGIHFNGWVAFYDDEPKAPTPDMMGKLCIVWVDGGEVLIKRLQKGGVPGLFSLYSNDAPIYDVIVHKAVKIRSMRET